MRKNITILLLLSSIIAMLLILSSCKYQLIEYEKPIVDTTGSANGGSGGLSFSKSIVPILNTKCIGCHNDNNILNMTLDPYTNFTKLHVYDVSNPKNSLIYTRLDGGHGGASHAEEGKILEWITEGAKNN